MWLTVSISPASLGPASIRKGDAFMSGDGPGVNLTYLNGPDIEALALSDAEILAAVEAGAEGARRGPDGDRAARPSDTGELGPRAFQRAARRDRRAARLGRGQGRRRLRRQLRARPALGDGGVLNLFDPRTGMPKAILDATAITDMRTGAVTALGAKHLARARAPRCWAISAPAARPTGTSGCSTACSTSTRSASIPAGRRAATRSPQRLSADLGKKVQVTVGLAKLRRGRGHRGRGLAPADARAAAQDRMDQARAPSSCPMAR